MTSSAHDSHRAAVATNAGGDVVLRLRGISKEFPGVRALSGVDLDIRAGECHALLGQNGAGKSTLVKIVSGAQRPSAGTMTLAGDLVSFHSPREAQAAGIYTIYQELSLVPGLSVAENVYLSDLPRRVGLVDWAQARRAAQRTLRSLGFDIDVDAQVRSLSVAEQQAVEIAKAVHHKARVLLLDEPTATLPKPDVKGLFDVLRRLQESGVGIVYISHRLDEVYEICDRISVLRDGRHIATKPTDAMGLNDAVRYMVGENLAAGLVGQLEAGGHTRINLRPVRQESVPVLEVQSLSDQGVLHGISLTVLPGEAVAVAGLVGSGQSELASCLFGRRSRTAGRVLVDGREISMRSPRAAVRAGLGMLPEDRKTQGLVLGMTLSANVTMASLDQVAPLGVLRRRKEHRLAERAVSTLGVRATHVSQKARTLSGGNQQKIVFAKWLTARAKVMIFNEPTRGIDVAAKEEIYGAIRAFVGDGGSALILSSEINEALMCDRIFLISRGSIVGEFAHEEIESDRLVSLLR